MTDHGNLFLERTEKSNQYEKHQDQLQRIMNSLKYFFKTTLKLILHISLRAPYSQFWGGGRSAQHALGNHLLISPEIHTSHMASRLKNS